MKQIWFKQKFYNPILEGQKTQTIRLWKRDPKFINNQEFECFFGFNHPRLIGIIKDITFKPFIELTEEEVMKDGYECKKILFNNLKEYYVDFCDKKSLYIIKFRLKKHDFKNFKKT
jgi:hypothetical protein